VHDALNYAQVSDVLTDYVEASRFELIEALAEACCELLLEHFNVDRVHLRLKKPGAVPKAITVGVDIQRLRTQA
jgi:dihydroneopterin aldolase